MDIIDVSNLCRLDHCKDQITVNPRANAGSKHAVLLT